jgi:hypothetical protein
MSHQGSFLGGFDRDGDITGMVRQPAVDTSTEAAKAVAKMRSKLQVAVYGALASAHFGMTDEDLDFRLRGYGRSTVSKRRTELTQLGFIVNSGERRINSRGRSMVVWKADPAKRSEFYRDVQDLTRGPIQP